jgi:Domain of unknown function (DUF4189)
MRRLCIQCAFLLISMILPVNPSAAEGALAIGLPANVVKGGFTWGNAHDRATREEARSVALDLCRNTKDAKNDAKLRNLCKVIATYHDKCASVAMDPAPGTPGVGWGIADDRRSAEAEALAKCEETAGPGRRAACKVDGGGCDGTAN